MERLLIVNLKRLGDVFQAGHLIKSLLADNPKREIHLLCYEESLGAAKVLRGISKVHTINRKKIISYYKNNIYSDGLAFNELNESLAEISNTNFSKVLNYSNDKVSTFISTYLCQTTGASPLGITFSPRQTINYSSPHALLLNDVLTQTSFTPYSFNEIIHKICGIKEVHNQNETIKSSKNHDRTAINNLDRLRTLKNPDSNKVSIVGIQLCSASQAKDINEKTIIETVRLINNSETMIPILLVAPFEAERKKANSINKEFDNKLVSVEADFIALPSVLKSLDLLVTPDTAIKHLADNLSLPVVEISLGHAPMYKQGTNNHNSAIISESGHGRIFKENGEPLEQVQKNNMRLSGSYVFNTVNSLLGNPEEIQDIPNQNQFCLYRPWKTQDGHFLMPQAGPYSSSFEARRVMARAICQKITSGVIDDGFLEQAYSVITKKEFQLAIEDEKLSLSSVTKDLLSTLRGLIQTQEDKGKAPVFIEALERLLSRCFDNSLSAIPALIFRAKVESLNSNSLEENFKEVETHLYQLKDNLQSCLFVFKRVEDIGYGISRPRLNEQDPIKERSL